MISLGCDHTPCVDVGGFVPGQLVDYTNHAIGLKDQHEPNSDHSFFPDPQWVFDFERWSKFGDDIEFPDEIPGTRRREVGEALAAIFAIDRRTTNILTRTQRAVTAVDDLRDELESAQAVAPDRQRELLAKLDDFRDQLLDAIAEADVRA
jgi:hypothetical protein